MDMSPHWREILNIDGHLVHIDHTLTWSGVYDYWLKEKHINDLAIIFFKEQIALLLSRVHIEKL